MPPDVGSGPLFDPLRDPLPPYEGSVQTDVPPPAGRTGTDPTDVLSASRPEPDYEPPPARYRGRRIRPTIRRVRRTLRHVDPLSVFKLSLFLYGCFVILWLIFVAFVYSILAAMGLFEAIEGLGQSFAVPGLENIEITIWLVEKWALIVGLAFGMVASLINVFLAFLYNLAADTVGGAEMIFVERES